MQRQALLAADDGVALNFDFGLGYGQGGHGDEGAAGETVAEYFPPKPGRQARITTSVLVVTLRLCASRAMPVAGD